MISESRLIELIYEISDIVRKRLSEIERKVDDDTIRQIIRMYVLETDETAELDLKTRKLLIEGVFNSLRRELDFLEKYVSDDSVSEVMVNGPSSIFVERYGEIERVPEYFPSDKELEEIIMRIGARVHREINELNPILDARLEDGSRVHAVYKNVALGGPTLNIRKFPARRITMDDLVRLGSVTGEAVDFLKTLVECGYNIFLSGGTSSGKTTFLNALSDFIPQKERVIVIEDSAELQLNLNNLVRLETKLANIQGKGEVTMRSLIKASLRMRPDRIIVGEVRGDEVVDMINSMNTGHEGSLSTGHANSARGMIQRLETMFLTAANFPIAAVRGQIASAVDIIVHLGRLRDKSRRVLEITEVAGYENGEIKLNPLFEFHMETAGGGEEKVRGELRRTGNPMINTLKLEMRGGKIFDTGGL